MPPRNMGIKGHSGEVSDLRNEEHIVGNGKKGNPCCKVAKNFTALCSSVLWNVERVSNETGCSTEEISKQSIEGIAWVLLTD